MDSDKKLRPYQREFLDKLLTEMSSGSFRPFGRTTTYHSGGVVKLPRYSAEELRGKSIEPFLLLDNAYPFDPPPPADPAFEKPMINITITSSDHYRHRRPHTDDMIQMIADLEAHGYGRRSIDLIIADKISKHLRMAELAMLKKFRVPRSAL